MKIGKCEKSVPLPRKLVVKHETAHHWQTLNPFLNCQVKQTFLSLFLFASNRNISLLCLKPFQNKKFQRLSFYMIEGDLIHVPRPCEHLEHVATGHRLLCLVPHPWASTALGESGDRSEKRSVEDLWASFSLF